MYYPVVPGGESAFVLTMYLLKVTTSLPLQILPRYTYVVMHKYMSMTAWCASTKSTSSSIIKLRVMPTEKNSQTGFEMLSMALFVTVLILLKFCYCIFLKSFLVISVYNS